MGLGEAGQRPQSPVLDVKAVQENWITQTIPLAEDHLPKTRGGGEEIEQEEQEEEIHETLLPKMEPDTKDLLISFAENIGPKYEEQNGQEGELNFEVQGDTYLDFGHSGQKAGIEWRMMDPSGEESRMEASSINRSEDLWTPPPDRESKLEVVSLGSLYNVRAYKGEKKPSRLYDEEEEEEERYKIPPEDLSPEIAKELDDERREVIKSQVVRKSTTMAVRWNSMDELEAINAAVPDREAPEARRSYYTGFATCFDNPSPSWVSSPVDPENIDTEQINFAAARQQFLVLEKANPKLLMGPKKKAVSPRGPQAAKEVYGREECLRPVVLKQEGGSSGGYNQREPAGSNERAEFLIPQRRGTTSYGQVARGQNSSAENLASSLGETPLDVHIVTADGKASLAMPGVPLDSLAGGHDPAKEPEASSETPIEREIRLSMEREQDFWKERGIHRVHSRDELVEIRAKPLLSSPVASPTSSRKGKEKPRVSFYVQREIEQETKREENFQKEGRLLGTYDRGGGQQLADRRKVFELEEETQETPCKPPKLGELRSLPNGESSPARRSVTTDSHDGGRIAKQDVNWDSLARRPPSAPDAGKRRPGNESPFLSQRSTASDWQMDSPRLRQSDTRGLKVPGEESALRKEHFAIPVQKLRFSVSDDRGPPSTQRREQRPEWAAPREDLYTLKSWRPRTSALIDQEIQDALQRELELQEQRRKARLVPEMGPSSRLSSRSSATSGVSGNYSVSTSPVFAPNSPTKLFASPSPDKACLRKSSLESNMRTCQSPPMRQREGGKYAGIELSDEIDTEVVNSTKVICRRGVLAQLWETGQIRRIDSDSD
ncbi:mitotic interactor and substrate of PLK1 [Elgaria multicarinata webbii]|uniref:mitotic interactor and substrate of PLK1 n=1 Tax=Elgaria multicarinata webbii TaxID=159646 RepID=UPI002FCCD697